MNRTQKKLVLHEEQDTSQCIKLHVDCDECFVGNYNKVWERVTGLGIRRGYFSQDRQGRLSEEVTADLPCAVTIYLG